MNNQKNDLLKNLKIPTYCMLEYFGSETVNSVHYDIHF